MSLIGSPESGELSPEDLRIVPATHIDAWDGSLISWRSTDGPCGYYTNDNTESHHYAGGPDPPADDDGNTDPKSYPEAHTDA